MKKKDEYYVLQDLTRGIHYKSAKCYKKTRSSTVTSNKDLVSCYYCLRHINKSFNKPLFLELLKNTTIEFSGLKKIVRIKNE